MSAAPSFPWLLTEPLILASASAIRAQLLAEAGIPFEVQPAAIDELAAGAGITDPGLLARTLAAAKARAVAARFPGRLVLGCDQTLACEGEFLHKPADLAAARQQLLRLRGRRHSLHTGLALVRDGAVLWQEAALARLTMRPFSDAFLDGYLRLTGQDVLASVGSYRYESFGIQLFERVEGEHSAILGLPLPPLLAALRRVGCLAT